MGARWLEVEGAEDAGGAGGARDRNGDARLRAAAWELAAETLTASRARTLTRRTLAGWRVADPVDVDDIVLMVDELVTNAIVHGSGPVRLRLALEGSRLSGEVSDDEPAAPLADPADPADPAGPGDPAGSPDSDWAEAGRGLLLVGALATEFGVRPAGRGKTVWFTRLLHGANGQPAR